MTAGTEPCRAVSSGLPPKVRRFSLPVMTCALHQPACRVLIYKFRPKAAVGCNARDGSLIACIAAASAVKQVLAGSWHDTPVVRTRCQNLAACTTCCILVGMVREKGEEAAGGEYYSRAWWQRSMQPAGVEESTWQEA